jgi:hypothetical protein
MDIGAPKRIIEIEPAELPVPEPAREEPAPAIEPSKVPAEPGG